MLYARLNISPRHMFNDVLISAFYTEKGEIPKLINPKLLGIGRVLFNESRGSELGKEVRWKAETKIAPHLAGATFSRNQLMNQSSEWFSDPSKATTDILHEYFLPRDGASAFLNAAKSILRAHHNEDLLNVTVREIQTDDDTFLRYADRSMFAFVMYFSQKRTTAADRDMQRMTQELVDAALHSGGRYYLPYRLHASTAEFRAAYPQAGEFFRLKKTYDPDELFENEFYEKYAKP